jgi:F-type H+-transporting ATPase subunit gamma
MESSKEYSTSLMDMTEDLFLSALQKDDHQQFFRLTGRNNTQTAGVVFITSNQGLCAGFNVALNQALEELEHRLHQKKITVRYYAIGKKAVHYLQRRKLSAEYTLTGLTDRFNYQDIQELNDPLVHDMEHGTIGDLYLIHTHYLASATHKAVIQILSPYQMFKERIQKQKNPKIGPIIFHPSIPELVKEFLPEIIFNRLYQALLESMVCEQIARRMAMKQATDAAEDKIEELRCLYHKVRQAKITGEVNEMMGTVIALQRE